MSPLLCLGFHTCHFSKYFLKSSPRGIGYIGSAIMAHPSCSFPEASHLGVKDGYPAPKSNLFFWVIFFLPSGREVLWFYKYLMQNLFSSAGGASWLPDNHFLPFTHLLLNLHFSNSYSSLLHSLLTFHPYFLLHWLPLTNTFRVKEISTWPSATDFSSLGLLCTWKIGIPSIEILKVSLCSFSKTQSSFHVCIRLRNWLSLCPRSACQPLA